jgi:hypothetical protein
MQSLLSGLLLILMVAPAFGQARPEVLIVDHNLFYGNLPQNYQTPANDLEKDPGIAWTTEQLATEYFTNNYESAVSPYLSDPQVPGNVQPAANGPACNGTVAVAVVPGDGFFVQTDYLGAISPNHDWTAGWTIWSSNGADRTDLKDDLGDPVAVEGEITTSTTWTNDKRYLLRGGVFVRTGATLTIEAGTIIFGEGATLGMLVIDQGAKLMAMGTKQDPIIFTSDAEPGQQARAQWGGLIINGYAPLNTGETAEGEGGTGVYGGSDPHDNSGVLRYVRVEFAGNEFTPENELNGIAFQGVGDGTTVEYVQVHYNKDDGIEMFGGAVDLKYCVVTGCADDSFDWTNGWNGRAQFVVIQQAGDDADNGIEADNQKGNNDAQPRSNPQVFNCTIIGGHQNEGDEGDIGCLFRAGTAVTFCNSIVGPGFQKCGLDIDNAGTFGVPIGTSPGAFTAVEEEVSTAMPTAFVLRQNSPNPFNPTTTLRYSLPVQSRVRLTVHNMLGQQVALLHEGIQHAGNYRVQFDGAGLGTGVYFCRLEAGNFSQIRKMLLVQ